jgi:hypothetical protein
VLLVGIAVLLHSVEKGVTTSPRAPVLFFVVSLVLTLVTFWSHVTTWQGNSNDIRARYDLGTVLAISAFTSVFFIFAMIMTAIAAVTNRNAPLHGSAVAVLIFLFVFGVFFMLLVSLAG